MIYSGSASPVIFSENEVVPFRNFHFIPQLRKKTFFKFDNLFLGIILHKKVLVLVFYVYFFTGKGDFTARRGNGKADA